MASTSATEIWGIALLVPDAAAFVSITGPGTLLVCCGPRVLASIRGSEFRMHPDFDQLLRSVLPRLGGQDNERKRTVLQDSSEIMREMGHGGAVAVLSNPSDTAGFILGHGVKEWRVGGRAAAERFLPYEPTPEMEERFKSEPGLKQRERLRAALQVLEETQLLRDIIQLTGTDGLLVLNEDFEVLSFGAKIDVSTEPGCIKVWEFPDVNHKDKSIEELGGTRHQSAARFVNHREDAIVLVVSQDGRSSLMAKIDNAVHVLRGFELGFPPNGLRFGRIERRSCITSG